MCNVFDAYSAVLFLPEAGGPNCRAVATFSLGDALDREVTIAPGQGLVGWIIREGKPLCIGNFDRRRGVLGYYRGGEEERIRAFMGYPVAATGGALCLDSRKTYTFGEKELKILSQFAELAGGYLVGAREVKTSLGEHRFYQAMVDSRVAKASTASSVWWSLAARSTSRQASRNSGAHMVAAAPLSEWAMRAM